MMKEGKSFLLRFVVLMNAVIHYVDFELDDLRTFKEHIPRTVVHHFLRNGNAADNLVEHLYFNVEIK